MTTLYRKDLGAPEDFTESRSIVCMIDRVCFVCTVVIYELLISLIISFTHISIHYLPERFAQVMGSSHRL